MTRKTRNQQSEIPVIILFIVVASVIVSVVSGLGAFHLKVLTVDVSDLPSLCSFSSDLHCKDKVNICRNNTVFFKVCLSHHQLPLPRKLKCTFGTGELAVPFVADGSSKDRFWRPEVVMTIPFTFSWPGGFSVSVSAFWNCTGQGSPGVELLSQISLADYISPSMHWTTFKSLHSSKENSFIKNLIMSSSNKSNISNDRTSIHRVSRQSGQPISKLNSKGNWSKLYIVNDSDKKNKKVSQLQLFTSDSSLKEADSGSNIHTTDNSQTVYKEMNNVAEMSSQTISHWRSELTLDIVDEKSDDGFHQNTQIEVLSTSAMVRQQGKTMDIAVKVVCQEHYFGNSCSSLCRPRNDLLGHYNCSEDGEIVCLHGWTGNYCTEAVCTDRCLASGGMCTSPYTCTCRHGWYGEFCERCRTFSGCKHGTCRLPGQCLCHQGWTGPLCDVEQLYCLEHQPCQNGGVCLYDNTYNYTCRCLSGYTGTHCEVAICHRDFCLHGGLCQIAEGIRYCLCSLPFVGARCQHRLTALEIQSSNTSCNASNCSTQFHRQTSNSQHPCEDVSCFDKFHKPVQCQGHVCYNKGTCILHSDSKQIQCACPFPFSGQHCLQVVDPCRSNPCKNGKVCKTTNSVSGEFTCVCPSGYIGEICDSKMADSLMRNTICDENVICQNGGLCERSRRSGQYFCKCLEKFTGEFCEIDNNNPCLSYTCLNGGSCVLDKNNIPECICGREYTGRFCQSASRNICSKVICQNGGTCWEHDDEFVCACRKNFEGILCEKRLRKRDNFETIRLETLTIRNEKLEIKIEANVKSAAGTLYSVLSISGLSVMKLLFSSNVCFESVSFCNLCVCFLCYVFTFSLFSVI